MVLGLIISCLLICQFALHTYKPSCVITVNAFVSYEVCLHFDSVNEHFQLRALNLLKATLRQNPSFMKQYNLSPTTEFLYLLFVFFFSLFFCHLCALCICVCVCLVVVSCTFEITFKELAASSKTSQLSSC